MNVERPFKIPRNGPCPCGSGRKYRKCCLYKSKERNDIVLKINPNHEDDTISIDLLKDHGEPHIDDKFFRKNTFERFSAPVIFGNMVESRDIEFKIVNLVRNHFRRAREGEEKRIKETDDLRKLLEQPITNPYTISLICVVLGLKDSKVDLKLMWDWFHNLKNLFPRASYSDGPLIALQEIGM